MACFLKKTNNKKGTYLQIYESYYDPQRKGSAHRLHKAIGYVHELQIKPKYNRKNVSRSYFLTFGTPPRITNRELANFIPVKNNSSHPAVLSEEKL